MIVIVDYNVGNLSSVLSAFQRIGTQAVVSRDKAVIAQAAGIVLPGVGTFPVAMANLKKYDLLSTLKKQKAKGVPILGICLGMQILLEKGYEVQECSGLGFIDGYVDYMNIQEVKIPHMGWNQLSFYQNHPLISRINRGDNVYFVHSYMAHVPQEQLIAYCEYGDGIIPAIIAKENVFGCQFHPEKSGIVGQKILEAFKEVVYANNSGN